ncbi:MAG: DUF115 domain-containing protein [Spirochaetales bacterium]|nr:DUF115 domain-containing protein [Spirochaetales bacterium]
MIEFPLSKNGELTAKYSGVFLHSSYSPLREAESLYCNENLARYRTLILLEPCLNYIAKVVKSNKPETKIISIYTRGVFAGKDDSKSDFIWYAGSDESLKSFLDRTMNELDLELLKLVEWPPSARLFSETLGGYKKTITQHLRELHGNITTSSGFGRRLIRNFIKNYVLSESIAIPEHTASAVFIAGSGPGLKSSISFLKKKRSELILISLPSSIEFLLSFGIIPDIAVTTDPGFYAGLHQRSLTNCLTASPYTANISPVIQNNKLLIPINQHSFIESAILDSGDAFINIPSNGTVAGTALFLASTLTSGPVILSGLDFSFIDILSHNRPHSFDSHIEQFTSRTNGLYNIYYHRNIPDSFKVNSNSRRTTTALKTYRGWFERSSGIFSNRCFFLNHFERPPGDFPGITEEEAGQLLTGRTKFSFGIYNNTSLDERRNKISSFLRKQIESVNTAENSIKNIATDFEKIIEILYTSIAGKIFLPDLLEMKRISFTENSKLFISKAVSLTERTRSFLDYLGRYAE